MISTGLYTAFAAIVGAFLGYLAAQSAYRSLARALISRIDALASELDAVRGTVRKVSGRMGAAIAHGHPIAVEAEQASIAPRREHIPLGSVLNQKR